MKNFFIAGGFIFSALLANAQISGTVTDSLSGEKIPGVVVTLEQSFLVSVTDASGNFSFPGIKKKEATLHFTHVSFLEKKLTVMPPADHISVRLAGKSYLADEVVVVATRASGQSPTAFSTIDKKELEKKNMGQDLPYLLSTTPSVAVTSDAGAGVGYTGIRIRGSDPTRINVTINGIPINDAEENGMYWVDLPDLVSSVDNIQIQRGIGTSTNGAGAFGGSINMLTSSLSQDPFATVNESYGSFNTWKHTLNFGTGLLKNNIAVEGRLSKINSDGFVDRASSDLKSFFLSAGYYGSKSTLRAIIFSGKEKTYQSWNGVPEAKLKNDYDALVTHYYNNVDYLYNSTEDSINLFGANNRTYNVFNYKNQTDNYQQDYYQLHYSWAHAEHLRLNAALHYTKGKGYYEEYKYNQAFSDYSLDDVVIGTDTIASTDLIRQKWLDNDFYGFTFSSNYETEKIQFTIGAAGNRYTGRHFDMVNWAQYSSNGAKDFVYSDNNATKTDFNVFAKAMYSFNYRFHFFADIQYRRVGYSFPGYNEMMVRSQQEATHKFINPKAGVAFEPNSKNKIYASVAMGNKEPIRGDYINSTPQSRPRPEQMTDVEAGYRLTEARLRCGLNFYFMHYKDQLILTGQINDVGDYTRMNVPSSYRSGLELEAGFNLLKNLALYCNVTASRNKISSFTEYVDDYNAGGQQSIAHSNTDIAFSPSVIAAGGISWLPVKNFSVDLTTKYVGKQYLDNTGNDARKLDAYFLNDILLQYRFSFSCCKEIALKFAVYNLFDEKYESNGYTYGYIYGGAPVQENFYYPQAGRNWLGGVTVGF